MSKLATSANGRVYVGTAGSVMASHDGGKNMHESYQTGLPLGLGASGSDPRIAYVFGWNSGASGSHDASRAILRTSDGGRTWSQRTRAKPNGAAMVDANDASLVYVFGDRVIFQSVDGAMTFERVGEYDPELIGRVEIRRAVTSGDGSSWWLATASGDLLQSADRGASWALIRGVPFTDPVGDISASPYDPGVLFVLTRDEVWMYRESPGAQARMTDTADE